MKPGPFLALLLSLGAGCVRPPPDVSPFAEQTVRLSAAAEEGFRRTRGILERADLGRPEVRRLERAWRHTETTLDALVAYAGVLADLAAAGGSGRDAGPRLAGALDDVLAVASLGPLPAAVGAVASELAASVAAVRAHRALTRAVGAAQPAVEGIAGLVVANLASLDTLVQEAGLELATAHGMEHQTLLQYRAALARQERAALQALTLILDYRAGDDEALETLLPLDRTLREVRASDGSMEAAFVDARAGVWEERLREARSGLAGLEPGFGRYVEGRAEIERATDDTRRLVRRSRLAMWAWARAHRSLQAGLEERRPVSFLELVGTVARLRDAFARGSPEAAVVGAVDDGGGAP